MLPSLRFQLCIQGRQLLIQAFVTGKSSVALTLQVRGVCGELRQLLPQRFGRRLVTMGLLLSLVQALLQLRPVLGVGVGEALGLSSGLRTFQDCALTRQCGPDLLAGRLQCRMPAALRQGVHHRRHPGASLFNGALAQTCTDAGPPGIQVTGHGVGRAGTQMGADPLDGGALTAGDGVVGGLMDIQSVMPRAMSGLRYAKKSMTALYFR